MTHLRNINAKKAEQDAAIRKYFSQNRITHDLASQVWHFRRRNRMATKARIKEADLPALKYLPERMREQLRLEVYAPILQQHPLFSIYKELCPQGVLQICNQALNERQVLAGEEVQEFKERVKFMLFVCYGLLEYHTGDYQKSKAVKSRAWAKSFKRNSKDRRGSLEFFRGHRKHSSRKYRGSDSSQNSLSQFHGFQVTTGEWACEIALWSSMATTAGPFVGGDSGCELVLLHAEEFQNIVGKHPKGFHLMAQYSAVFIRRFNQAYQNPLYVNVLFNDPEEVNDMIKQCSHNPERSKSGSDLGHRSNGKFSPRWGSGTFSTLMNSKGFPVPSLRRTLSSSLQVAKPQRNGQESSNSSDSDVPEAKHSPISVARVTVT